MKAKNKGFSVIEALLIVALLAVLGFVGWRIWEANNTPTETAAPTQSQSSSAPEINNASDLDQASKAVDEVDLTTSDQEMSDLEKELDSL